MCLFTHYTRGLPVCQTWLVRSVCTSPPLCRFRVPVGRPGGSTASIVFLVNRQQDPGVWLHAGPRSWAGQELVSSAFTTACGPRPLAMLSQHLRHWETRGGDSVLLFCFHVCAGIPPSSKVAFTEGRTKAWLFPLFSRFSRWWNDPVIHRGWRAPFL